MEDRNIIDLFFQRDKKALTEMSDKYGRRLLRISANILGDGRDAEDCVNDTYLKVWNSIPPNDPENLLCYAAKIVRNLSINLLKRNNTLKRGGSSIEEAYDELSECLPDSGSIDDRLNEEELAKIINAFLESLPKKTRSIFVRKYWRFDSIHNIAKDMKMSEGNVKSTLFKTRQKLKKLLSEEGISI